MPMNTPSGRASAPSRSRRRPRCRCAARRPARRRGSCRPAASNSSQHGSETTATGMPSAASAVARRHGDGDLRAGGDQRGLARARRPRPAHSRRARSGSRPASVRSAGSAWRVSTSRLGPSVAADRQFPALRRLHRVGRAEDMQVRHGAQAGELLDRLVRRAVLAQADAVMGQHVDDALAHQRGQADRRAHVVGEDEEGAGVGDQAAMQRHAVGGRGHAVLAHAVMDVAAGEVARRHRCPCPSPGSGWSRSGRPSRRPVPASPAPAPPARVWLAWRVASFGLLLGDLAASARRSPRASCRAACRPSRARTRRASGGGRGASARRGGRRRRARRRRASARPARRAR